MAIIERYVELADESLAREQDYEQAMRDQQKHDDDLEEQEAQEQQRQQREAQQRQRLQEEQQEREDKADYNRQKANLSREFPEERDIINATMRWYKSDWRNYQGDLRRQLVQRTQDRYSRDLNEFNNAKQRILSSYPEGEGALRGWGYDPGWREDEREMRNDAKRAHDQEVARLKRNADFARQLQQDIRDRAAAAQEGGYTPAPVVIWDDELEGESYPYIPAPVVTARPAPVVQQAPPPVEESLWQRRARLASEAAELREAYAGDWDEF